MDYNSTSPGDLLVTIFKCGPIPYEHFSLVTDNKSDDGLYMLISATERTGTVKEEPIQQVVQGYPTHKVKLPSQLPADKVIENARECIDNWDYSVTESNCEHFVNLAYGLTPKSKIVTDGFMAALTVGATALVLSEKPTPVKMVCAILLGLAIGIGTSKAEKI